MVDGFRKRDVPYIFPATPTLMSILYLRAKGQRDTAQRHPRNPRTTHLRNSEHRLTHALSHPLVANIVSPVKPWSRLARIA